MAKIILILVRVIKALFSIVILILEINIILVALVINFSKGNERERNLRA